MIQKQKLQSVISKYHLNGLIDSVKWQIENSTLNIEFISPNKDMVGKLTTPFSTIPATLAIFNTSQLNKLIGITDSTLRLDFLKQKNETVAVFADDSGLEVDALNSAPGVYSARYAGVPKNDANNNKKLLEELKLVTDRKARFVTVITLIINNEIHYFEGEIKGTIAYEGRGENGFGYDPIFVANDYTKTFAELSIEEKSNISHRGIAVKQLIEFFK
jgi:XTP/dITP diphosphohydrolase